MPYWNAEQKVRNFASLDCAGEGETPPSSSRICITRQSTLNEDITTHLFGLMPRREISVHGSIAHWQ